MSEEEDRTISLVTKGDLEPRRDGNELYLAVASKYARLLGGTEAKNVAYDARYDHGFESAGIEKFEGPLPINGEGQRAEGLRSKNEGYARWAVVFKLTRGIV